MKLIAPFTTVLQKFGENAVSYYQTAGLRGHPGIDYAAPWGIDIPAAIAAPCYSVFVNTDPAFYQAVFTIYDDTDGNSYEISYGHCSTVMAHPGLSYKQGDILGKVGNTGEVFQNGTEVSEADKLSGSHAGAHLHFQVRMLKKVPTSQFDSAKHYVNDGHGLYTTSDGYNYEVPLWNNGYNGCVDPEQFITGARFTRNLSFGMKNTDVLALQIKLGVKQTGYFGLLTLWAVMRYQRQNGISTTGYVGPLTRMSLNATL